MSQYSLNSLVQALVIVVLISIVLLSRRSSQSIQNYISTRKNGVAVSWLFYLILAHVVFLRSLMTMKDLSVISPDRMLLFIPAIIFLAVSASAFRPVVFSDDEEEVEGFLKDRKLFFSAYALYHVWIFILAGNIEGYSTVPVAGTLSIFLSVSMMFITSYKWQISGSVTAWLITTYSFVVQIINS